MRTILFCGVALVALSACDAIGSTGLSGNVGAVRFAHSAAGPVAAGTYDAEGTIDPAGAGGLGGGTWAYAELGNSNQEPLMLVASQPSADAADRYDVVVLGFPRTVRTGDTFTEFFQCEYSEETGSQCANLAVFFRVSPDEGGSFYRCQMGLGGIRVMERTADRIKGTFSGVAGCSTASGGNQAELRITDGTFDVPIED